MTGNTVDFQVSVVLVQLLDFMELLINCRLLDVLTIRNRYNHVMVATVVLHEFVRTALELLDRISIHTVVDFLVPHAVLELREVFAVRMGQLHREPASVIQSEQIVVKFPLIPFFFLLNFFYAVGLEQYIETFHVVSNCTLVERGVVAVSSGHV
jgi:hypothetical protein